MTRLTPTLLALATSGTIARAEPPAQESTPASWSDLTVVHASRRGVAQDYLVMPSGGELTGHMRFIVAEPGLGGEPLKFSDLALFGIGGRWSVFSRVEVSLEASFLAKQPSFTDEKPWQSVGGALRSGITKRVAVQLSGGGGHLIAHEGMWTKQALVLQWRKPIAEIVTFDLAGGVDAASLTAPRAPSAFLGEAALQTSALFREPTGHWGAWIGMGYAIPFTHHGKDPTTGIAIDPQPRLDLRIGTVLSMNAWDLFAELTIVDRGDRQNPATQLPILDGGFDQQQVILGVTRHIDAPKKSRDRDAISAR